MSGTARGPVRRVLIVEDDRDMAFVLQRNLECEGYEVRAVHDGVAGIAEGLANWAHLIVLDLMLPEQNGFTVLRTIRGAQVAVPVLLLTARSHDADKLQGFRLGADDYVTKPFSIPELAARVHALIRRNELPRWSPLNESVSRLQIGRIEIDFLTRTVTQDGRALFLSPKGYDLLAALMRHANVIVRRADLLRDVWGYADGVESRTLDTHINELRRKLERDPANPRLIKTVWGVGYILDSRNDG
jgi:DNA-binding response OmpR family regulator